MREGGQHTWGTGRLLLVTVKEVSVLLTPKKSTTVTLMTKGKSTGIEFELPSPSNVISIFGPVVSEIFDWMEGMLLDHLYVEGRIRATVSSTTRGVQESTTCKFKGNHVSNSE